VEGIELFNDRCFPAAAIWSDWPQRQEIDPLFSDWELDLSDVAP
jgi:hypothetical protein